MGLKKYAVKRLVSGFITVVLIIASLYFIFRLPYFIIGRSPAKLYGFQRLLANPKGLENPNKTVQQLREKMGIPPENANAMTQLSYFFRYMKNMMLLHFGPSTSPQFRFRSSTSILLDRLPQTLMLMGPSVIFAILLGLALAVESSKDLGSVKDEALTVSGLSLRSLPIYWLGPMMILIFVIGLGWWPNKLGPTPDWPTKTLSDGFFHFIGRMYMYILPIATLIIISFGGWLYLLRNSLADVMSEDFIFTAKAKGLNESAVLYRHALRNAILPAWTNIVLTIATFWEGAVITETLFQTRGVGSLLITAIRSPIDYGLAQTTFFFIALTVIVANIIADISYGFLDPRVSYEQ